MKATRFFLSLLLLACATSLSAQRPEYPYFSNQYQIPFPKAMLNAPDTVSVIVIGDVMMHAKQLERDHHTFLEKIAPTLRAADFAVANLEFPLGGEPYAGYPAFSTPDYYAWYAAEDCGIDVFLTGNNHVLDRASRGLQRTLDVYEQIRDSLGVRQTGAARNRKELEETYPLMLSRHGVNIALVNFTYGTNSGADAEGRADGMEAANGGVACIEGVEADARRLPLLVTQIDESCQSGGVGDLQQAIGLEAQLRPSQGVLLE